MDDSLFPFFLFLLLHKGCEQVDISVPRHDVGSSTGLAVVNSQSHRCAQIGVFGLAVKNPRVVHTMRKENSQLVHRSVVVSGLVFSVLWHEWKRVTRGVMRVRISQGMVPARSATSLTGM